MSNRDVPQYYCYYKVAISDDPNNSQLRILISGFLILNLKIICSY
ncbi:unnamed protein product [Paramecium octaurelia]|uniref:Uncharacterized protein n=1 Tax=Paramecium octaurelia TaxID=43137 RepID=A0A8S1XW10_PAROT|nr:unnamed protein product [Paramecium octaurelia]